jgi:NAD-dependent deacetylase
MEVASPQGWAKDRALVLDFYNQRRKAVMQAAPNEAHKILAELEKKYDVHMITQNIDDLHERGGSTNVLHLHGEIKKARSCADENLIYELEGWEIKEGDLCEKGAQLRPHIVWFGEMVPMIEPAALITAQADILLVVGTSLQVYPAAGLIDEVGRDVPIYVVDPHTPDYKGNNQVTAIAKSAVDGMKILQKTIL